MVEGDKMKKSSLYLMVIFCGPALFGKVSYASEFDELGARNPFLEEKKHKNKHIEPNGVVIYSFAKNANKITELESDRAYLQETKYTTKFGFANVHSSKVRNFNTLISQYKDYDADLRLKFKRGIINKVSKKMITPQSKVYAFKTADLSGLIQNKSDLLLESPSGNFIKNQGWDSLTRIVNSSTLGTVIIREWDFSLSNGGVIMDKDAVNFNVNVNGHQAILIVREDDLSNAETVLSWADDKKSYNIELNKNVNTEGLIGQLRNLAESMSEPNYLMFK